MAAEFEVVAVPPLPAPKDPLDSILNRPRPITRDEHLRDLRHELRTATRELAEIALARNYFRCPPPAGAGVPFAVAEEIFGFAVGMAETAEHPRSAPPTFAGRAFLRKVGLPGADPDAVTWTADLIERGLALHAGCAAESPDQYRETVRVAIEESAEEIARKVRRLEGEVTAVAWLLDGGPARPGLVNLFPAGGRDERIANHERHLHALLTSTLHELERLQARREGQPIPPPAVADVNVTVDTGPG